MSINVNAFRIANPHCARVHLFALSGPAKRVRNRCAQTARIAGNRTAAQQLLEWNSSPFGEKQSE